MPATTNKGYEIQTTGTNAGTWGDVLNNQAITYIDLNMGGVLPKGLSSSNVILTATESRYAILRLTGILLANVQVTTSCVGFFFVENLTTGAFTVTITNGVSGVVVPASNGRVTILSDGTNGCRMMGASAASVINTPAGGISATTVQAAIDELETEKAGLASPTFTGVPLAPTAAAATNTTQIATTAFTNANYAQQSALPTSAVASIADAKAGTNSTRAIVSSVLKGHPGVAKAWVAFIGATAVIGDSYNIASVVRSSTGVYVITFTVPFATTSYAWSFGTNSSTDGANDSWCYESAKTASSITINVVAGGAASDPSRMTLTFHGSQ